MNLFLFGLIFNKYKFLELSNDLNFITLYILTYNVNKYNIESYNQFVQYLHTNTDIVDKIGIQSLKFLNNFIDISYNENDEHNVKLSKDERKLLKYAYYKEDISNLTKEFDTIVFENGKIIEVNNKSDIDTAVGILTDRLY